MFVLWIIIGLLILLVGLCVYSVAMPGYMVRRGRKVDAKVVRCEQLTTKVAQQSAFFYEVTVEFFDLDGETVEKTFRSETPLEENFLAVSRYVDGSGRFLWDADNVVKNINMRSTGIVILTLLGFIGLLVGVALFSDDGGNLPDWSAMAFGYVICIIFIVVGCWGLLGQYKRARNKHNQQTIPGYVVDYVKESDTDSVAYYPIYEYEVQGIKYRMRSNLGTGSRKRCTMGKKVRLIRDYETGEITCAEDEKGSRIVYIVFAAFGILVLIILLSFSTDIFTV